MNVSRLDVPLVISGGQTAAPTAAGRAALGAARTEIFRFILACAAKSGDRLVDLGAGPCIFSKIARDEGCVVTAVDARTVRKPDAAELGPIGFVHSDVRTFDLSGFDIIAFLGLLYHFDVADQMSMLERCARTGLPVILETQVHIETLVPDFEQSSWARKLVCRQGYEGVVYPENDNPMASIGNPESFWPTEESLLKMAEAAGFRSFAIVDPVCQSQYGARRFYLLNCKQYAAEPARVRERALQEKRAKIVTLARGGHFDEARERLAQVPPIGDGDWEFLLATALVRLHFGEREQALSAVRHLRDVASASRELACLILLRCARFFEVAGLPGEASAARAFAFEQLVDAPSVVTAIRKSAMANSDGDTRRIIAFVQERFAGNHDLLDYSAWTCCKMGDFDAAERICRTALLSAPENAKLLTRLGYVLSRRDMGEEAALVLERVLKIDAGNLRAFETLVPLQLALKRFNEAERDARAWISVSPRNGLGHWYLASVLKQTRRRAEALEHARLAVELEPGNEKYGRYLAEFSNPNSGA